MMGGGAEQEEQPPDSHLKIVHVVHRRRVKGEHEPGNLVQLDTCGYRVAGSSPGCSYRQC